MWRLLAVVCLVAVSVNEGLARTQRNGLSDRLKRSPHYGCRPYYYPRLPPPPPPPPPFWYPPPPPQPPPPPPPHPPHQSAQLTDNYETQNQDYAQGQEANIEHEQGHSEGQPCHSCANGGQSSSISNAQSDSGTAVAVAIARANS